MITSNSNKNKVLNNNNGAFVLTISTYLKARFSRFIVARKWDSDIRPLTKNMSGKSLVFSTVNNNKTPPQPFCITLELNMNNKSTIIS